MTKKNPDRECTAPKARGRRVSAAAQPLIESSHERIERECSEELVIALCGPIGSPLHGVAAAIQKLMKDEFAYESEVIRLSGFIKRFISKTTHSPPPTGGYQLISALIDHGNVLRQTRGISVLADLAIDKIARARHQDPRRKGLKYPSRRTCYILDSIKNTHELATLRAVYGDALCCIGVFSPIDVREAELAKRMKLADAHALIARDSGEAITYGQSVRKVFQLSDYFLRCTNESSTQLSARLRRFIGLILGTSVETPTASEMAMANAALASMNSGCLSRKVGAAIVSENGRLLSVGWNDVPKFGGGLYGCPTDNNQGADNRCGNWGTPPRCHSYCRRNEAAESAARNLARANLIGKSSHDRAVSQIRESKVGDIIEFSRSIHAEMHALLNALASGVSVSGASLYCTTYPCHLCATHLLGAGISKVYYIEPYRKSLAVELHSDAISEDERAIGMLRVLAYEGVAPRRFAALFGADRGEVKDSDGRLELPGPKAAKPRDAISLQSVPDREEIVIHRLREARVVASSHPGVPGSAKKAKARNSR